MNLSANTEMDSALKSFPELVPSQVWSLYGLGTLLYCLSEVFLKNINTCTWYCLVSAVQIETRAKKLRREFLGVQPFYVCHFSLANLIRP